MKIADGLTARLIGGSLVLALLVPGSALALPATAIRLSDV